MKGLTMTSSEPKEQATNRPWKSYVNIVRAVNAKVKSGRCHYMQILVADCLDCDDIDGKANAKLIVKAVNCHDELVQCLKHAIDGMKIMYKHNCLAVPSIMESNIKIYEQALAKANE